MSLFGEPRRAPELNLMAAIMMLAVADYLFWTVNQERIMRQHAARVDRSRRKKSVICHARLHGTQAKVWLESASDDTASFRGICELLDINGDRVLMAIRSRPHEILEAISPARKRRGAAA